MCGGQATLASGVAQGIHGSLCSRLQARSFSGATVTGTGSPVSGSCFHNNSQYGSHAGGADLPGRPAGSFSEPRFVLKIERYVL